MKVIWLANNQIWSIHPRVFDNLINLTTLSLYNNTCIDVTKINSNESHKFAQNAAVECNFNSMMSEKDEKNKLKIMNEAAEEGK